MRMHPERPPSKSHRTGESYGQLSVPIRLLVCGRLLALRVLHTFRKVLAETLINLSERSPLQPFVLATP